MLWNNPITAQTEKQTKNYYYYYYTKTPKPLLKTDLNGGRR